MARIAGPHPVEHDVPAVGRPGDRLGIVEVAGRSVCREPDRLGPAGLADHQIVVLDQRLPLAVGRAARMVVGRCREIADHAEAARSVGLPDGRALIVGERAAPARLVHLEADGGRGIGAIVERIERQALRIDRVSEGGGKPLRDPGLIEGGRFGERMDVDRLEGETAVHRLAIGEMAAIGRPCRRPRDLAGEIFPRFAEADRSGKGRSVRHRCGGGEEGGRRAGQREREQRGPHGNSGHR